ncbi:serine hydrolase [Corynebacterium gerontici]|uniref:Beta-lactamase enzyme family protein n=1 Tax=Corynebacterium gerontici TaxID=2079234 RepID=A0A3G6J6V2_9CORY|nr:hypothetical protein [Corynebacterium gerontici]AZA12170.1 hypothetical protein CGERO_09395 [Corynebacterium gerontici]
MSTSPKRILGGLGIAALSLSALASCVLPEPQSSDPSTVTSTVTSSSIPSEGVSADLPNEIREAIAQVEEATGSRISLAIASGAETEPKFAGSLAPTQPAWSTIKVPLSIAALRQDSSLQAVMAQAITQSDNSAAEQLWESLGGGEAAAKAVEAVLAEAGTPADVPATKFRPQFSPYGQTEWSTGQEATFGAQLAALPGAEPVLEQMGNVVEGQAYGLGTLRGARFKGGWGPDTNGAYLVRQFGVLPSVGNMGIAIAVIPADGTYETGQTVLNKAVAAIEPFLPLLSDAKASEHATSSSQQAPELPEQPQQTTPEPTSVPQKPNGGAPEGFSSIPAV